MTHVHHAVRSVIAADSALVGLLGIGGPQQFPHADDDARPFQRNGDDGRASHEIKQLGEQGLPIDDKVQDMGVMFPENGFIKLNHLYAAQAKPFRQQAFQDGAGKIFPYAVGFQ